ncbi:unnamed protein product [Soboliphyme baturini]|uniref:MARVEL domain-containing protein n=1 Tax=Soboliphyme baturini TaxID=241478 RepID=A0A183ISQ5_9BILA|nr:unnamed protein product [Soboliphyme baturini]
MFTERLETSLCLRIAAGIHFTLITLVLMGRWVPMAYLFANTAFIMCLFWSITASEVDSPYPLLQSFALNIFCLVLDVFVMTLNYGAVATTAVDRFSISMSILNFMFRLASVGLLYYVRDERKRLRYAAPSNPAPSAV